MDVSVVIPTYKERENLPELIRQLFTVFDTVPYECEIMFVNDYSGDKTEDYIEENKDIWRYPVYLITRYSERGLASACIKGFSEAHGDIIIVMDADLQHPPEKIKEMIEAIKKDADIVVGSRYTKEGSIGDFGFTRRIISKGASFLFNTFFPDIKISDTQSGFFAFKKEVIADADLRPKGYKILLEILVHGEYKKIEEIGIGFRERYKGSSKLGIGVIFSYLIHLLHLLYSSGKMGTLFKFCLVGFSGVFVNLGTLYFLTNAGVYYLLSGLVAVELSLLTNFFVNRMWTFKKLSAEIGFIKSLFKDHVVRLLGIAIKMVCLFALTEYFGFYYITSMIIGIIVATMWNFIGNVKWVWKK